MKKRVVAVLLIVAVVGLMWWWLRLRPVGQSAPIEKGPSATSVNPPSVSPKGGVPDGITSEDLQRTPIKGTESEIRLRIQQIRQAIKEANRPVAFYGKVVDQNEKPLAGAKVTMRLLQAMEAWPGVLDSRPKLIEMVTGANGLILIAGENGNDLELKDIKLDGYELSPKTKRGYSYYGTQSIHNPDSNAPVVFRMWKKIGAEKLVVQDRDTRIPYDGTPVSYDLRTNEAVVSGGDIRVTLLRTPVQIKRGQDKYDWEATVEAIDGGLVESSDEFMYLAPEAGYQSKLTLKVASSDKDWSSDRAVSFYLKSRDGKSYGRIMLEFRTDSEKSKTGFTIRSFINPNGSRNLEYDSTQGLVKRTPIGTKSP